MNGATSAWVRGAPIGVVLVLSALTGCSGGMKGQIAKGIGEDLDKEGGLCFSLQEKKKTTWPLRVQRRSELLFDTSPKLDPILAAMQAAGYITVKTERSDWVDVITPTDEARKWWDDQTGFCVGKKAIAEVVEWTEPNALLGGGIEVKYTWHLVGVPSWAKRPEFKDIKGMSKPAEGDAILQKTNKGWTAHF
jgi:hypothetical protein